MKSDISFMKLAILEAEKALTKQEVPIGAIIVDQTGKILSKAHNLTESKNCQSRHAEVIAIEKAAKKIKDWRLENCTIFVTLEPCIMCMALICLSRINRLVFGANSLLFGYHLDKETLPDLYKKQLRGVTSGILTYESKSLLKKFFKAKRIKSE